MPRVQSPGVKFRFIVSGGPIAGAGFSRAGGLRDETEVMEYREGDDTERVKWKYPGLISTSNVTLSQGIADGRLVGWRQRARADCDPGADMNVEVKDCNGSTKRVIAITNAWPLALEVEELDAMTSEVAVEMAEFAHEGIKIMAAGGG